MFYIIFIIFIQNILKQKNKNEKTKKINKKQKTKNKKQKTKNKNRTIHI